MFDAIMVPVDFSEHAALAFGHAALLARSFGGRLELVHVVEQVVHSHPSFWSAEPGLADELHRQSLGSAQQLLAELAGAHAELGPAVGAQVVSGSLPGALADHASASGVDLIVISTHGRTGFARWLMGSVTERLLRVAPCSVLVVRGRGPGRPDAADPAFAGHAPGHTGTAAALAAVAPPRLQRILAAVDLSESSRAALHAAGELAARLGAALEVVYASSVPGHGLHGARPDLSERLRSAAQAELAAFVSGAGLPGTLQPEQTLLSGPPSAAISEHVRERDADLLVLGTHGHAGVGHMLLGSVAESLARYAACATLLVR